MAVGVLLLLNHFVIPSEAEANCGPPRHFVEIYRFQCACGPQIPPYETGGCEYFCDGSVSCWGTQYPNMEHLTQYEQFEFCGPCTPDY
jgi:hypothetical protein